MSINEKIFDIKVLYVEDDESIRTSLTRVLRRIFKEVIVACDGQDGLEAFILHNPEIVITDIKMPRKSGLDMAKEIKLISPSTPIAITTAHSESEFLLDAINSHIDHFLMKPIDYEKLLHTVELIAEDIDIKKRLKVEQERFMALLDFQPNIVVLTDGKKLLKVNRAFFDFFGYETLETFFGEHECICDFFIEEEGFLSKSSWQSWVCPLRRSEEKSAKAKVQNPDTKEEHIFVVRYGELDEEELFVVSFTDITEMERQARLFEKLSTTDTLTGAMNRLKFNEIFELEFNKASRYGNGLTVVMLDIDHFKDVNDTYGHECGDVVLTALSDEVARRIRKTDTFARWGGEEFMLLLPNTAKQNAIEVADSLRQHIQDCVAKTTQKNVGYKVPDITCSFGVAEFEVGDDKKKLLGRVDEALYCAKHAGRNQVKAL